jgi:hypothetical protein
MIRSKDGKRRQDHKLTFTANQYFATRFAGFSNVSGDLVECRLATEQDVNKEQADTQGRQAYITGPMKLSKFCGGPTLIFAVSLRNWSLNPPSHADAET